LQYCTTSKTSGHRPRGTYIWGTFFLDRELSDWAEGGNLPSWSKKQQAFSLQTYSCVSFYQFPTKITTFCRKTDNFAHFDDGYMMGIYQSFELANIKKGHVRVAPIGNSLRMRLKPGP